MSDDAQPEPNIARLALAIERAGLVTPARIALDTLAPLDVIGCQIALFARPFTMGSRFAAYAAALSDERGWQELRALLGLRDC
jgi:hypothetical protein